MSQRIKFSIDYIVKSSPVILYDFVSSPSGLSQWFADEVDLVKNTYVFRWENYEERALILEEEENEFIRFQMDSADDGEYLEFRVEKSEVTADTIFIITDFAEPSEIADQKKLWNSQVDALITRIGGKN